MQTRTQERTTTRIAGLVEQMTDALPVSPELARQAGAIISTGEIERLPNRLGGIDEWSVEHEICSLRDKRCSCGQPPAGDTGPLCRHRLAAMLAVKVFGGQPLTAGEQIANLLQQSIRKATPLYLRVVRVFTRTVKEYDILYVEGWRNSEREPWRDVKIQVDDFIGSFWSMIEDAGWQRTELKRGYGGESWTLTPREIPLNDNPFDDEPEEKTEEDQFRYTAQKQAGGVHQEIDRDALVRHVGEGHATLLENRAREHGRATEYKPNGVVLTISRS